MKRIKYFLLASTLVLLTAASAAFAQGQARTEPYAIGADVSWVHQRERSTNYRQSGETQNKDMLDILKDNRFNYIRLRLFVDPAVNPNPPRPDSDGWNPYPYNAQGYCGLDSTIKYAKKVKDRGLKFLLDFHYSDTWADPARQHKPVSWDGLNFTQLTDRVRTYTKESVQKFVDAGARPDMVQVGNEVVGGMLWPDGRNSGTNGWQNFARLVHAGIRGVKEVDPDIKIMMHTISERNPNGWVNSLVSGLNGVEANYAGNVDVIGLSYYPRWHGDRDSLRRVLNAIVNNTNTHIRNFKVCVVEYADYHREVNDLVYNLPNNRGFGTFVWEPQEWATDNAKPLFTTSGNPRTTNSYMALFPVMSTDYGNDAFTNIGAPVTPAKDRRSHFRVGHNGVIDYRSDVPGMITVYNIQGRLVGRFEVKSAGVYDPARFMRMRPGAYIVAIEQSGGDRRDVYKGTLRIVK